MNCQKYLSASLLGMAVLVAGIAPASALDLRTTLKYAVLSAEPGNLGAVTCTDSTITGEIGSSGYMPGVVQTRCSIAGSITAPVSVSTLADFDNAFKALQSTRCQTILTGTQAGVILPPGVYCFDEAASLTGTLTLDGPSNGVWIFLVNGDLTGNSFTTLMAGEGKACNVFWSPTGAATMTTSNAKGNIFAGAAITLTDGTFTGRAFAKNAVTLTRMAATGCGGNRTR